MKELIITNIVKDNKYLLLIISMVIFTFRNILANGEPFGSWDSLGGHVSLISFVSTDYRFFDLWSESSFGYMVPISFIKILGLFVEVSDTIFLYNTVILLTMIGTVIGMYFFAHYFTKNKVASFVSAFIFIFNQWIVAKYSVGHLMHVISYFLLPPLFFFLYKSLESGKVRYIVSFSIILSLFPLMRLDPLYYVIPFVILFVFIFVMFNFDNSNIKRVFKIMLISFPLFIFLTMYIFLPVLSVPTIYQTVKYSVKDIDVNSLNFVDTLLGHSTSITYSNIYWFSGISWKYNPYFSTPIYKLSMSLIPIFAILTILLRRNYMVTFFITSALISVFFGKGVNPPFDDIYMWLYNNVPYFSGLHVPNRWLAITWFCYAFLVGIFVNEIDKKIKVKSSKYNILTFFLVILSIFSILAGSHYIFVHGYQSSKFQSQEFEPHLWLEKEEGEYRIFTVPFYQTYMFLEDGTMDADIGKSGYFFHKKPIINTIYGIKFNDYIADFMLFIKENIKRYESDKLIKILGIYDTKCFVLQGYPPNAPNAIDRLNYSQHEYFENQEGLTQAFKSNYTPYKLKVADFWPLTMAIKDIPLKYKEIDVERPAKVYKNDYWIPRIFTPRDQIIVIGGLETFLKLSNLENFDFDEWNLLFADRLAEDVGKDVLIDQIKNSDYITFVNSEPLDLSILLANVISIKLKNFEKDSVGWYNDEESIIKGLSVYNRDIVTTNEKENKESKLVYIVKINESSNYDIWIRTLLHNNPGKMIVYIDKYPIGRIEPYSTQKTVFKWTKIGNIELNRGHHEIEILNNNGDNKLNGIILAKKGEIENTLNYINDTVKDKSLYLFDIDDTLLEEEAVVDSNWSSQDWKLLQKGRPVNKGNISGEDLLKIDITDFSTNIPVEITNSRLISNWSNIKYISFWFKGGDSRKSFNIWIYFNNNTWPYPDAVRFGPYYDNSKEWRKIAISVNKPAAKYGNVAWDKVSAIVFAINRQYSGTIYLDNLSVYRKMTETKLESELNTKMLFFDDNKPLDNYIIKPKNNNITYLEFKKIRPSKWNVRINSTGPYIIVFSNSYHPMWRAYVNEKEYKSIPSYYFINSFHINETGEQEVIIEFIGQRMQDISLVISGLAYFACFGFLLYDRRERGNVGHKEKK